MKIGDRVAVLDDVVSGVVISLSGAVIKVLTEDGFEIQFSKNELVVVSDEVSANIMSSHDISQVISEKETKKPTRSKKVKPKERSLPPMEVDLHIHQLTASTKGLSNYDMLTMQLDTAKRQLDFAFKRKIQRVVFIHGVGEGVLKMELEFLFKNYENLKFYEADYQKYGQGATEVYIFQNKNS